MSEEKKNAPEDMTDSKAKFREAIDKKKKGSGIRNNNIAGNAKIHGGQTDGGAPKMFRRKSGSA